MLTAVRLREVLHYDPDTGRWTWLQTLSSRGPKGSRAGHATVLGYRIIRIDGEAWQSHRLAVLYVTGEWPAEDVDHKNGIPGEDWWDNLRPATMSQNRANSRRPSDNTSGFKGVSWFKATGKWRAQIALKGKKIYLGCFDTPEAAHAAYVVAAERLFGKYARAK